MPTVHASKYALITGASSGIGRDLALQLAARGWNVALVARRETLLLDLETELKQQSNVKTASFAVDLSEATAPKKVYDWAQQTRLDVGMLVNCAGIGSGESFSEGDVELYTQMIQLNVQSLVQLSRYFVADMVANNYGYIMNIASMAALYPIPYKAVYASSKGFVRAFSIALNEELRETGVSVTVICPGPVITNEGVRQRIQAGGWRAKRLTLESAVVAQVAIESTLAGKRSVVPGIWNHIGLFIVGSMTLSARLRLYSRLFKPQPDA